VPWWWTRGGGAGGNGGSGAVMVNATGVSDGWYHGGGREVAAAQGLARSEVLFGRVECGYVCYDL
jgi:hypothetical protein